MKKLLLILLLLPTLTYAQSKKQRRALEAQRKADELVINNLKSHIQFLSDDKLEGRSTGSNGEQLAADYISQQFQSIGLIPKGTNGFIQEFTVEDGKVVSPSTTFAINSTQLILNKEYFPLAFSAQKALNGAAAIALREAKEPWFFDVKDLLETNNTNNIEAALRKEALNVAAKGATALIIYNSSNQPDNIHFNKLDRDPEVSIPVIYVTNEGYKKFFKDKSALLDVDMNIGISDKKRMGKNVIGLLDNHAAQTVVVAAHLDHLGWGEDNNAMDTGKVIRNGADDNASGVAALIELAKMQVQSPNKNNNYLFVAFSGEELNQVGSKYWLDNPGFAVTPNYMINLDMIGRYDENRKLVIGGFGTSPDWKNIVASSLNNKLQIRLDSAVANPGDHAAFYRKSIPVLYFFTGNHSDYHKAGDDADKINAEGELQVIKLVNRVMNNADSKGKLSFQRTAEQSVLRSGLAVSLGIIPDNSYSGPGLRIVGVTPNKLAATTGLVAGDILLQLNDYPINDMNSYMQAMSTFKKGDKAVLKIKRAKEDKVFNIEF